MKKRRCDVAEEIDNGCAIHSKSPRISPRLSAVGGIVLQKSHIVDHEHLSKSVHECAKPKASAAPPSRAVTSVDVTTPANRTIPHVKSAATSSHAGGTRRKVLPTSVFEPPLPMPLDSSHASSKIASEISIKSPRSILKRKESTKVASGVPASKTLARSPRHHDDAAPASKRANVIIDGERRHGGARGSDGSLLTRDGSGARRQRECLQNFSPRSATDAQL